MELLLVASYGALSTHEHTHADVECLQAVRGRQNNYDKDDHVDNHDGNDVLPVCDAHGQARKVVVASGTRDRVDVSK